MSTLRISNIEAKANSSSPSVDEKLKFTNSSGDVLVHVDGKTSGITTIGINTTAESLKFDSNNNIYSTGIITATKFSGIFDGSVTATTATFSGDVSIGGTLTYQDVTNIDSVGVITARSDIRGGRNLNVTGITTLSDDVEFVGTTAGITSVTWDKSANKLLFKDNSKLVLGTGEDFTMYHDGLGNSILQDDNNLYIKANSIYIEANQSEPSAIFNYNGAVKLYYDGGTHTTPKLQTSGIGVTVTGTIDLDAISTTISGTAVDLFVYDTRKDSDGGAWRKRTSHTSWYNETFSATRGSKKEFPAVAVISVIGGTVSSYGSDNGNMKIKIYDGDDPEMPLWMEFEGHSNSGDNFLRGGTNYPIENVAALNGVLCIARKSGYGGALVSFIDEFMYTYWDASSRSEYAGSIAERNSGKGGISRSGNGLVNATTNDVAMTVLPNAKIMKGTGLPSPTIAFATDVGVTVVREIGVGNDFVDVQPLRINDTNGTYDTVNNVEFTKDHKIVETRHSGTQFGWMYVNNIPSVNQSWAVNNQGTALSWYDSRDDGTNGLGFSNQDGHIYSSRAGYGVKILHTVTAPDDMIYATTTSGVTMIQENRGANRSALVAYVTHLYNTGWLHGDQKFCLSDTDDTDKTNTQTEYDRSIAAKNLTVYGTVTKTAVATGAEMVSWSFGNSHSNYLKQDYTVKLQFGTGSFSVMAWIKMADYSSTGFIFDRGDSGGGERIAWYMESDDLKLYTYNGGASEIGNGTVEIGSNHDGKWVFAVETRHSSGLMEAYINGELKHSQVSTVRDVDNGDAHLIVGGRYNNTSGNQFNGEIALLRMSKSVPSAEQVAKIYNDEKLLFNSNAKCALYGSSSSITALAHDEDTDTLHVGTSGGRSDFTGLNRINNTTTAVTTAISASNGLIIEQ